MITEFHSNNNEQQVKQICYICYGDTVSEKWLKVWQVTRFTVKQQQTKLCSLEMFDGCSELPYFARTVWFFIPLFHSPTISLCIWSATIEVALQQQQRNKQTTNQTSKRKIKQQLCYLICVQLHFQKKNTTQHNTTTKESIQCIFSMDRCNSLLKSHNFSTFEAVCWCCCCCWCFFSPLFVLFWVQLLKIYLLMQKA